MRNAYSVLIGMPEEKT